MSLKDKLFAATERRYETVAVPELPDENGDPTEFRIRSLFESERSKYESSLYDRSSGQACGLHEATTRLLVWTLVDENGDPLLKHTERHHLDHIDAAITNRLYQAAARHVGIVVGREYAAKNSSGTSDDGSS